MDLQNRLPLPALAFRQFDREGRFDCVVSVRGTFLHKQDGTLALAEDQEEFQWEDAFDGDPHTGVMLRQSDLVPEKPGTDVTFLGSSFAPGGDARTEWVASLRVGRLSKSVDVHGARFWTADIREKRTGFFSSERIHLAEGWRLSEAEPTREVPVSWKLAYGGPLPEEPEEGEPADVDRRNPLGRGILPQVVTPQAGPVPAPQITGPGEALERDGGEPQGLSPIPPWWRVRQQYAGTYDEGWIENRHPLLPLDFDPRFWQCAHPDLIAVPHLRGDEDYELHALHPAYPVARGRLPAVELAVHCGNADEDSGPWHWLNLDGVHFDFRDGRELVLLTWRARFPLDEPDRAVLTLDGRHIDEPDQATMAREEYA